MSRIASKKLWLSYPTLKATVWDPEPQVSSQGLDKFLFYVTNGVLKHDDL